MKPVCTLLGCVDARRLFCHVRPGSWPRTRRSAPQKIHAGTRPAASCTRLSNTGGRARGPVVRPRNGIAAFGSRTTTRSRPGTLSTTAARAPAGRATFRADGGRWRRALQRGGGVRRAPAAPDPGLGRRRQREKCVAFFVLALLRASRLAATTAAGLRDRTPARPRPSRAVASLPPWSRTPGERVRARQDWARRERA